MRSVRDNSHVRCWLEQEGAELEVKLIGVIMFVVGVNPVEVRRFSNPKLVTTFDGVSIITPSTEEVVGGWAMVKVKGRLGLRPCNLPKFGSCTNESIDPTNSMDSTSTGSLLTAIGKDVVVATFGILLNLHSA